MKLTDEQIKRKAWESHSGIKQHSWNECFESEQEILDMLMSMSDKEINKVKGQDYVRSFKTQIESGKSLSEKQITQLKRLAWAILFARYCDK